VELIKRSQNPILDDEEPESTVKQAENEAADESNGIHGKNAGKILSSGLLDPESDKNT